MYKKTLDFKDKLRDLHDKIANENLNMDTNPDIFSVLKSYTNQIDDLQLSVSGLRKDIRQKALIILKDLRALVKSAIYTIYEKCLNEHVVKLESILMFMIKYPYMFIDENNDELFNATRINTIRICFWHLLRDYFVSHDYPELFVQLCKNTSSLSSEEMKSLFVVLVKKMFSTLIHDLLEETSNRTIDRKKELTRDVRAKYPEAPNKYDNILLSKHRWDSIKHDFLEDSQSTIVQIFDEEPERFLSDDFHSFMNALSIYFMTFANKEQIDIVFTKYVFSFLSNQFYQSEKINEKKTQYSKKNQDKEETQYKNSTKEMISSVFPSSQESANFLLPLPQGLSDDIRSYLSQKNTTLSCDKLARFIEKTLQKLLTKKEAVRKERFKNKINSLGSDCVDDDFFELLQHYGFACNDKKNSLSDNETDVLETTKENGPESKKEEASSSDAFKSELLNHLSLVDNMECQSGENKETYIRRKVVGYVDIFSELGYQYEDREKFIEQASVDCAKNQRLLKDIRKILFSMITVNKKEVNKQGRNYFVFALSEGRRIILYKKGVISVLCSHDFYETHLKNNY